MLDSISDADIQAAEREIDALAALDAHVPAEPDEERISRILQRAKAESLLCESISFAFKSFGTCLDGLAETCFAVMRQSRNQSKDSNQR